MAPFSGSEFDLLKGEWIRITEPVFRKKEAKAVPVSSGKKDQTPYKELMKAVKDLNDYAESLKNVSNGELRKMTDKIRELINQD